MGVVLVGGVDAIAGVALEPVDNARLVLDDCRLLAVLSIFIVVIIFHRDQRVKVQWHLQATSSLDVDIGVSGYLHAKVAVANKRHNVQFVGEGWPMPDVDVVLEGRVVERSKALVHAAGQGV